MKTEKEVPVRSRIAAALFTAALVVSACDLNSTPTKVASGQLYQSGDGRYDAYFTTVHQEQVAAASWPDESKAARKPIITALDLKPGASNTTILAAARERRSDAALGRPVDETTAAERELAKRLTAAASKLEDVEKRGDELKKQAVQDKQNLGADKADEAKVAKKDEVKRELSAAVDAASHMLTDARRGAKEAEELGSKLRSTWSGKEDEPKEEPPKEERKKPEPPSKRPVKKPASPKPDAPAAPKEPAEPKPAAEKPKPKPPEEVFNP